MHLAHIEFLYIYIYIYIYIYVYIKDSRLPVEKYLEMVLKRANQTIALIRNCSFLYRQGFQLNFGKLLLNHT